MTNDDQCGRTLTLINKWSSTTTAAPRVAGRPPVTVSSMTAAGVPGLDRRVDDGDLTGVGSYIVAGDPPPWGDAAFSAGCIGTIALG